MSRQPRPHPQASGTAARSASIGTATKRPTRIRSPVPLGSGSRSGRDRLGAGTGGASTATPAVVVSVEVVMVVLALRGALRPDERSARTEVWGVCRYAYVTVTYATVGCARAGQTFLELVVKVTTQGRRRPKAMPTTRSVSIYATSPGGDSTAISVLALPVG